MHPARTQTGDSPSQSFLRNSDGVVEIHGAGSFHPVGNSEDYF